MAERDKLINYRTEGPVAIIELQNPPANAYSYEMFRQLDEATLRARMDNTVHALLLTGSGDKFFCAGADISMLQEADPEFKYYFCLHANETLLRLEHTPKLVICAINGHCVGGGLEVAMAADIRIAKKDAGKVGLPEVSLGVLPGTGGTQRLVRLVGKAKAMDLMIRGTTMSTSEAHELGIVNEILPSQNFFGAALDWAMDFCPPKRASRAVGLIKRAVQSGADLSLESGLALERELQQRLFTSADAKEGLAAFTGKRPPQWTGR